MTVNAESKLMLGLSSGVELIANRVMLFPEADIQEILSLRAKAQETMGGFSTGLGFWGSPGWAIGGAAILGFAESLISNSKMKNGLNILKEVAAKVEELKSKGVFFDIAVIRGIHWARPGDWRAVQVRQSEIARSSAESIGTYAGKFIRAVVKDTDIETNLETVKTDRHGFICDDNDFINFEVGGEPVAVRWATVERYELVRPVLPKAADSAAASRNALPKPDRETPLVGDKETSAFGRRGP
jgi:hypothetical protein